MSLDPKARSQSPTRGRRLLFFLLLCALVVFLTATVSSQSDSRPNLVVIRVDGMITKGMQEYIVDRIDGAEQLGAEAVIIELNTPGGLVDATLDIIQRFSTADLPVVVYVAPSGAIAASAGAFILTASHVAAMAPGTTTGAAMPVQMSPGGGAQQSADQKTINFLSGHMKSIARNRGRPEEIAGRFVTENLTLDAREARERAFIDFVSPSLDRLLADLDGFSTTVGEETVLLRTEGAEVVEQPLRLTDEVKNIVSNPQIAFILLIIGIYGLYFGLSMPGTLVPEVFGTLSLVLGIYGLGLFQTNVAGILLLLLGLAFLAAEAFTPTHGVLGVAGLIGLFFGALFLPREPLLPAAWFDTFTLTAFGVVLAAGVISFVTIYGIVHSRRERHRGRGPKVAADRGVVVEAVDPEGVVRIDGVLWQARSASGTGIESGESVKITEREGLWVTVTPIEQDDGPGEEREPE